MAMLGTPLGRLLLDRPAWTYLLGPFFKAATPDAAAPLSATYREAGAVGALTVTDTTNKLSVSAGNLAVADGTTAWNTTGVYGAGCTRTPGRSILARLTPADTLSYSQIGWLTSAAIGQLYGAYFDYSAKLHPAYAGVGVATTAATYTSATAYDIAVVLRASGFVMLVRGGSYTTWTIVWIDNARTDATVYPGVAVYSGARTIANLRVVDLGGAWASDYGICTDRKATSAATDTITHTANCLVEHTITAATGVTQELWVRRTDASNGWIVRMDQAGSTIKLIELVAGVETERASTAQTWTNATQYRVVVVCDGTTITPYVANVAKTGYASATTNQSATTAYVDTAGVDLVSWPRTVSLPQGV